MGWYCPETEKWQWQMVTRSFGIERLNMCPVTGMRERFLHEYQEPEDMIEDRVATGLEPVYVDVTGAEDLVSFDHPENALYLFGKVGRDLKPPPGASVVKIVVPKMGLFWPHEAAAIVLWDRYRKEQ